MAIRPAFGTTMLTNHAAFAPVDSRRVRGTRLNGTPSNFVRFLGYRLRTRMVWDEPLPATPKFEWHDHYVKNPDKQDEADDRDPEKVLKHASEQTGLKFTKAKRKVPVLVLSPKK